MIAISLHTFDPSLPDIEETIDACPFGGVAPVFIHDAISGIYDRAKEGSIAQTPFKMLWRYSIDRDFYKIYMMNKILMQGYYIWYGC